MAEETTSAGAPATPTVSATAAAAAAAAPAAGGITAIATEAVTIAKKDYETLKAAAEKWIVKQDSWLKRNWLALVGHLTTIGSVIGTGLTILSHLK
jgi:hypothetical protein